ncbi:13629_t:CDS:2, partial [Cetraspora pellucida]
MNDSNYQDMELEVLNNQNIEPEASNDQNVEPEALDNQDVELEVLAAYNSTDDLSDIDINNFDDIEGFSIGKTFKNWDQVADFMKKYAIIKGHGIRISGVTTFNNQHVGHELNPLARQFDPTLRKLPKEIAEEIRFLTTVAKANATMQYKIIREKYSVRIYRPDLYKTIQMFRHDSEPGEDDAGMLLKRLNEKKIEDPRWF